MLAQKRCSKCGVLKYHHEFAKHTQQGLQPRCRICLSTTRKERYQRNAEQIRQEARDYAASHRAEAIAKSRKWYRENRERALQWQRTRRETYRLAVIERTGRKRATDRGNYALRIPMELLKQKVAYWGDKCWMCGGNAEAIDHVKPIAVGGPHILANLRPACSICNVRKPRTKWVMPK